MNKSWSQPSNLSLSNSTSPAPRSVISADEPRTDGHTSPSSTIRMASAEKIKLPIQSESLNDRYTESWFIAEYCLITVKRKLGGIYVIPSRESQLLWFGVLFVHHGPYQGGVFRFTIQFHDTFPSSNIVPTVTFEPNVFHPFIHPSKGYFELRRYFKVWSKSHNHIWQILRVIRNAFYKIEGSTVNKRANDLLENDMSAFILRAQQEVKSSHEHLYDAPPTKDPHWIKFSPYDPSLFDPIRAKMLSASKTMSNIISIGGGMTGPKNGRGTSFM